MSLITSNNPLRDAMIQIMDKDGRIVNESLRPSELTDELLKQFYEEMTFIRMADDKFNKLQRQGRMGTYASCQGQEACQIPVAHVLKKEDWVVPAFRELGIMVMRGVPLQDMYRYWGGFETGSKMPEGINVLPVAIPVGTQLLHAVGIAWALKLQKKPGVTTAFCSDGATSTGDFNAAMNFAGVYKTATVFFCQNNQYAISTPRAKQTSSKTLAQKAIAYDFPGIQVDGNDALAVYTVAKEAVDYARAGNGPVFIEEVTFRQGAHTTSDDPTKYISAKESAFWLDRDPLKRLRIYLESKKLWSAAWQKEIETNASKKISTAVELYENTPPVTIDELFDYVYAKLPPELAEQKKELK